MENPKQSPITKPKAALVYTCTEAHRCIHAQSCMHPLTHGYYGLQNHLPFPLHASLFTHAFCGRFGSSTFMQTPACADPFVQLPASCWMKHMHLLEKAVSPSRSLPPVKSFHVCFMLLYSLPCALCQVSL